MFPGLRTRITKQILASAATIYPEADLIKVTGNTSIATIQQNFGGQSGILMIVPTENPITLLTTGNIAITVACAVNRVTVLVFDRDTATWYPGAIS